MDTITPVTRRHPQPTVAVPVSINTVAAITALFLRLHEFGYSTNNQTSSQWRLVIQQSASGAADQVIYFGDYILVTDGAYDPDTGEWEVSAATRISCYGISTELAGTAEDFDATFAPLES